MSIALATPIHAPPRTHRNFADVVVVGAGFGGLGAALRLAERGARVVVCESLNYPGGCAGTFERDGCRFEAGATLFSGFGEGQLFGEWIRRHDMPVEVDFLDPAVEFRTPEFSLKVPPRREEFLQALTALPGAPVERIRAFFREQHQVAEVLWSLFDHPELLPPFGMRELLTHAGRLPKMLPLTRLVGRPLLDMMRRHRVDDFAPLRQYLDALCQITVQTSAARAEAPFALATLDYYFRGTGHVRDGVGALAHGMVGAIRALGGEVQFTNRVKRLERAGGAWMVHTRRGEIRAGSVIANMLPQDVRRLTPLSGRGDAFAASLERDLEESWGAAMLYLVARAPEGAPPAAKHLQLVQDTGRSFTEGNHLFCSISDARDAGRAPAGCRTLTVSSHVPMNTLRALDPAGQAAWMEEIQERMRQGLRSLAPEWAEGIEAGMTASPRTFSRFTSRHLGYVGGIPRRAGLHNYRHLVPPALAPGLHLVGDSVFPGQSTLATAVGGVKLAERLAGSRGAGSRDEAHAASAG